MGELKILLVDIETKPLRVWSYGVFNQFISPKEQIDEDWNMLSYAAKWLGGKEIFYRDLRDRDYRDDKILAKEISALFKEADIVLAHNGDNFDIKKVNERLAVHRLGKYFPFDTIDTCKLCRKHFGFTSNSLAYVCERLGLVKKLSHSKFPGFQMIRAIKDKNKEAWRELELYNKRDVECLEALFWAIQPYCKIPALNHIELKCVCGSEDFWNNGTSSARGQIYQRYMCKGCRAPYQRLYSSSIIKKV